MVGGGFLGKSCLAAGVGCLIGEGIGSTPLLVATLVLEAMVLLGEVSGNS